MNMPRWLRKKWKGFEAIVVFLLVFTFFANPVMAEAAKKDLIDAVKLFDLDKMEVDALKKAQGKDFKEADVLATITDLNSKVPPPSIIGEKGRSTGSIVRDFDKELENHIGDHKKVDEMKQKMLDAVAKAGTTLALMKEAEVEQRKIDKYLTDILGEYAVLQQLSSQTCNELCALEKRALSVKQLETEFKSILKNCQCRAQTCYSSCRGGGIFGGGRFLRFLFIALIIAFFITMIVLMFSGGGGALAPLSFGFFDSRKDMELLVPRRDYQRQLFVK